MKTIEISQANKPLSDYAKQVAREAVVIVKNGKPLAVLSSAKGMDAESIALANNPKFVSIIERSRARHEAKGGLSAEEVRRQLGLAPAKKRRRR
jgi:prevent-host-death family protein